MRRSRINGSSQYNLVSPAECSYVRCFVPLLIIYTTYFMHMAHYFLTFKVQISSTTYCILYRRTTHSAYQTISIPSVHTVVHLCATQVCCPEFISHKTAAMVRFFVSFFFVIIQLNQQYPSRFGCDVAALCIVGNSR